MKKYALIGIALCSIASVHAHPIVFNPETSTVDNPVMNPPYNAFYNLIHNLTSLAHQPSHFQSGVKIVEETLANIIQTAFQLFQMGTAKLTIHKNGNIDAVLIEEAIPHEMMQILAQQTTRVAFAQYPSDNQKDDDDDDQDARVLANFANIVQHFFGILQAPRDPNNVAPNLVGMLSGIVKIGVDVIKRSNLSIEASDYGIKRYVEEQLDDTLKRNMFNIIAAQTQ